MFVKINDNTIINLTLNHEIYINSKVFLVLDGYRFAKYPFTNEEQTQKAFNLICEALSQCKTYLDLTKFISQ